MEIRENGKYGKDIFWAGITGKGKVREANEDIFAVDDEIGLFTVSDGIGGHAGGEIAAGLVKEHFGNIVKGKLGKLKKSNDHEICKAVRTSLAELNELVVKRWESDEGFRGMGATVVTGLVIDGKLYEGNAGDSAMFLMKGEKLSLISKEHSFTHELFEKGRIKLHEKFNHPYHGVITQHAGMEKGFKPYIKKFKLEYGDRVLLCSDGLTDMVGEDTIKQILKDESGCEGACKRLYEMAMNAGGLDNITILILDRDKSKRDK